MPTASTRPSVGRDSLVNLLDRFPIVVDCPLPKIPCFTVQDIFLKTVHESFLSWEAHLHFLHQKHPPKRKNRKHILTVFTERMCFLALFLRKVGFELFTVQSKGFGLLLQAFLNSNSHGNGHTDHGVVACAQEASEARFRGGI